MNTNEKLFDFIKNCPTAYHTVKRIAEALTDAGFTRINESDEWNVAPGGKYFVTRNSSSIIAFCVPEEKPEGFMIAAAHSDSPSFKIKPNFTLSDDRYVRLATEKYGGMLMQTWFDRPLSVAGRLAVRTADGIKTVAVDLGRPVALIPSVAPHMTRGSAGSAEPNPAVDLIPLAASGKDFSLEEEIARCAGVAKEDIISTDLFVYVPEEGIEFGSLISAPRLDDLQCAFACTEALISATPSRAVQVSCVFDNEEVGSSTKQGAASTFLESVLRRVSRSLGIKCGEHERLLASSMMLSCDNAHAVHPNRPEYADRGNDPVVNGGVVIKYNANQRYTTDAVSAALAELICERAGVPHQRYANRADIPGGSTLGSISDTKVSVVTADIGLAQLAMHSAYETAGADDTGYMIRALKTFFSSSLAAKGDGEYALN